MIDYNDLMTWIVPEALIMIPVLYIVILLLRQTPKIPVWLHAWIVFVIAVVACLFMFGFRIESFIQGVLIAGASTLMKDLIHKTMNQAKTNQEDDMM